MGEIIKVIGKGVVKKNKLEIELNKPHNPKMENSVHIQSDDFRLEMKESEFFQVAFNTLKAIKSLKRLKGIKDE